MLLDLLRKRRSIRQFMDKPVEDQLVEQLIEAALRSPSSRSLNPWEFIVVDDKETLEALSKAKPHGCALLKNAPLAIVVCGDPQRCDVWVEDCSISTLLLHLAATDLGLGSCWVQIRMRENESGISASSYVSNLLGIRDGLEVEAIMAIGYPAEEKKGHGKDTLLYDRISYNRYDQSR